MKTILCPTNNSLMAINAAQYAESLSDLTHAELLLFDKPLMANLFRNAQRVLADSQPLPATSSERRSNTTCPQDLAAYPDPTLQIQTICSLAALARSEQADLIVQGVEKGFGLYDMYSDAIVNLVKQTQCPALFLPEGVKFKPLKQIVVGMDQEMNIDHRFDFMVELATLFQAEILFLQVCKEPAIPAKDPFLESMKEMYFSFPYENTSFHRVIHTSLAAGIYDFIANLGADLVIIVPNLQAHLPYSYLSSLLHEQSVAKPLTLPLLALDCQPLASSSPLRESTTVGEAKETSQLELYKEQV